jgi:hypothetical protein
MGMVEVRPSDVPIVRCRLDGPEEASVERLRYVPLHEFELWRHLMETRHGRQVSVEAVSVWVAENPELWNSGYLPDELEPVLRVRLSWLGALGVPTPIERFFPAETYPQAQEALLSHHPLANSGARLEATPGYFVPAGRAPLTVAA